MLGLDYEDPKVVSGGILLASTLFRGKKARDAKTIENKRYCVREEFDDWFSSNICKEFDFKQEIVSYEIFE